jgi:glycosyltransferase involved in cell wall biosynthesis
MRLAIVGSFYPETTRLGTVTTGLVDLLSSNPNVSHISIFAQEGASLHPAIDARRVSVFESWRVDDPPSFFHLAKLLREHFDDIDRILFNVYLTVFGKSSFSNSLGLCLPMVTRLMGRKPVSVYMHNFIETQNLLALGYGNRLVGRVGAMVLERLLAVTTDLVAPLPSQASTLARAIGRPVRSVFVPFVEALPDGRLARGPPPPDDERRLHLLMFGAWGPQKDLATPLRCVSELLSKGTRLKFKIAGGTNTNFPRKLPQIESKSLDEPATSIFYEPNVPYARVPALFGESDLLLMPYNATGGYSGVMNVAAYYGIPVIAYDVGALRETATLSGAEVRFIPPHDVRELAHEILVSIDNLADLRLRRRFHTPEIRRSAHEAARLFGLPQA